MIEIVAGDVTENTVDGAHHLIGFHFIYHIQCVLSCIALDQPVIVKYIAVPPQLGAAQVLSGKSLLVEAYHPKREVLRGAFAVNALQLRVAVLLQVGQWIPEALLLVLMR